MQLAFVVVLHLSKGIGDSPEGSIAFRVTWNLADDKLVVCLGRTRRAEVDRRQELEPNDADHENREGKQNVCRE